MLYSYTETKVRKNWQNDTNKQYPDKAPVIKRQRTKKDRRSKK